MKRLNVKKFQAAKRCGCHSQSLNVQPFVNQGDKPENDVSSTIVKEKRKRKKRGGRRVLLTNEEGTAVGERGSLPIATTDETHKKREAMTIVHSVAWDARSRNRSEVVLPEVVPEVAPILARMGLRMD